MNLANREDFAFLLRKMITKLSLRLWPFSALKWDKWVEYVIRYPYRWTFSANFVSLTEQFQNIYTYITYIIGVHCEYGVQNVMYHISIRGELVL